MANRSKEELVQEFRVQTMQDAAIRVIARKGMSSATVQDIADEAGVAKGTIYLYFSDRDALVEQAFSSAISQLQQRLEGAMAIEASFEEKLRTLIETQIDFFDEHRELFRIFVSARFGEDGGERPSRPACTRRYQAHIVKVAQFLQEGIRSGEVRELDADRLALFLTEGINAILMSRVTEDPPPPREADARLIVDTILGGICARRKGKGTRH